MNIQEELRISGYQPTTFMADTEMAELCEALKKKYRLDRDNVLPFTASVFYNLGKCHGKREERARRRSEKKER